MNKKFIKVLFSMASLMILGKGLGFIRTAMVASTYGAGFVSDIYSFEDSFINEIYTIFATFLACSFIPKYLSLDCNDKNKLFSLLLNWGIIVMLILFVGAFIFTSPLLHILVPGFFEIYDVSSIVFMTRVNLVMLVLTFLVNYLMIVLQAHEIFIYLSLESIILNVIVVVYLWLYPEGGILGLLLCRVVAYVLLLILVSIRVKDIRELKYVKIINPINKDLLEMVKFSLPMLLITVLWQINYVIDKSMASKLESGSIACLHYANTISMIIYNVIGYIVSTYAYPLISKVQNDNDAVKKAFKEYFIILLQLILPIAILTVFYSDYVTNFLYGHGNMTNESLNIISLVLMMYIPGSVAYCIKNLYSKLFYIKKSTKIVLFLDIFGCLVNIILNVILINIIGVYGLALATSISNILTVVLQVIFANKKEYTNLKLNNFKTCFLSVALILVISVFTKFIMSNYINGNIIKFVYVFTVYLSCCMLFSCNDLKKIIK